MLSTQLKSITDLRLDPFAVTQLAKNGGPVYILNRNKPVSVILDVKAYETLIGQLQDAMGDEDLARYLLGLQKGKGKTLAEVANSYGVKL